MSKGIYIVVAVLFVLHQDFWWWDTKTLVMGVLPVSLAYHLIFSLVSAVVWAVAVKVAWPTRWEAWADAGEES